MIEFVNWLITLVSTCTLNFIGGLDGLIKALLIFIFVEYITRIICVIMGKISRSKLGINELIKKVLMLILVGTANTIDVYILNSGGVLRTFVILFYISYIGKTILENEKLMGVIIPPKFKKVIKELCNDDDENNEKDT